MAPRDDTPITFTVADRLLAESTAASVDEMRDDLKQFMQKLELYITEHAKQHRVVDAKVTTVQNTQKVTNRVLKAFAIAISAVSALAGVAKAFKIF